MGSYNSHRYSMPGPRPRNGLYETGLDGTNVTRFLFGDEEAGYTSSANAGDERFPTLVRRDDQMVSWRRFIYPLVHLSWSLLAPILCPELGPYVAYSTVGACSTRQLAVTRTLASAPTPVNHTRCEHLFALLPLFISRAGEELSHHPL